MAKNDKVKDDTQQDVQADVEAAPEIQPESQPEPAAAPAQQAEQEAPAPQAVMPDAAPAPLMPVENQQALHNAARDPNQALLPGRDEKPAHEGVVGEFEALARKAELDGELALAGDINQLLVKLGEVYQHIAAIEHKLGDNLKSQFGKISALFKK